MSVHALSAGQSPGEPTEGTKDSPSAPHASADAVAEAQASPLPHRLDSPRPRPSWAVLLLGRVRHGDTIEQARTRSGSHVSQEIIQRYGRMDPPWWADLMDASDAALHADPLTSRDYARAEAYAEGRRRHELAMTASERYAHPYMRLGAEVAGDVGASTAVVAQQQAIVLHIHVQGQPDPVVVQVQPSPALDA